MGINYNVIKADIVDILPNFENNKIAFIAKNIKKKDEEQITYIFKPSWVGHYHNVNEYIAHHIGSLIGAPILDGVFLEISPDNMQKWDKIIKSFHPSAILPTFIPPYNRAIFFAVEFKQDKFHAASVAELSNELKKTSNKEEYYAQFSLDQYLKNPDRHLGNHIFYQEPHKLMFYLIDFDRLFRGHTDWSTLDVDIKNFSCFKDKNYNMDLYPTVCNTFIRQVHDYAAKIEKISDEDLEDILKTTSIIYGIDKINLGKLSQWLYTRRDEIYNACLINEPCYPKVSKRGYLSASI